MVYPDVNDNAGVPELVIGFPEIDNPVGTDISTLVTVPVVELVRLQSLYENQMQKVPKPYYLH
jgi:hypothetical protein